MPVVVKCRWRPLLLRMALAAVAGNLLVKRVVWCLVAGLASFAHGRLQQRVIESPRLSEPLHPRMVTVAGHAILANQFLVKRCCG